MQDSSADCLCRMSVEWHAQLQRLGTGLLEPKEKDWEMVEQGVPMFTGLPNYRLPASRPWNEIREWLAAITEQVYQRVLPNLPPHVDKQATKRACRRAVLAGKGTGALG